MYIILLIIIIILLSYGVIPTIYLKIKQKLKQRTCQDKVIYLTFDDGPSEYTEKFLDLFKKLNIKVSFFVVAEFANKYPDTIKRMIQDGHLICYHSLNHQDYLFLNSRKTINNFEQGLSILKKLNLNIKFFRAPWGRINITLLKKLKQNNIKLIIWDVMAQDWRGDTTSDIIANKLLKRVKSGSVICLHDGRGTNKAPTRTLKALEKVLPIYLKQGYKFLTIDHYK